MTIIDLEIKVGVNKGFFQKLLDKDDWSFIIKLHALIEAICTQLLLHYFDEPELNSILSKLEMSNKSIGKLAFIKSLKLLGEEHRKFISSLSELRNQFVHNVKFCNINLKEYINTLNRDQLKIFAISFRPFETILRIMKDKKILNEEKDFSKDLKKQIDINNIIDSAKNDPKSHIWLGAYSLLISIVENFSFISLEKNDKTEIIFSEINKDDL